MGARGRVRFLQQFTEERFRDRFTRAACRDGAAATHGSAIDAASKAHASRIDHEHSGRQRLSRRRVGGAGARRAAHRGRRGRALPPHQALRRRAAARDAGVPARWAASRPADVDVFAVSRDPRAHLMAQGAGFSCGIGPRGTVVGARAQHGRRPGAARRRSPTRSGSTTRGSAAHPLCRASSRPPGERGLRLAVRRGRRLRDRRVRRFRQHVVGPRRRNAAVGRRPRVLSALARHAVSRRSRSTSAFPNYGDEFKVMGLAPYGEPRFVREIELAGAPRRRGQFELDLSYFRHCVRGRADDVGGRRADHRHACSRRSSSRCSVRRAGATSRSTRVTRRSPRRSRWSSRRPRCTCCGTCSEATGGTRCASPAAAR